MTCERKKQYNKEYQRTNLEKWREYNKRWRQKNHEKIREYCQKHKEQKRKSARKWARKHGAKYQRNRPEQVKAVSMAQYVHTGSYCLRCNSTESLQKHHSDYSRPLDVITLCAKCHSRLHRLYGKFNREQAILAVLE